MALPAASYGAAASLWAASLGGKEEGDGRRPGKGTCKAMWHEEIAVFEVLQPRGDSLKSMVSTHAAWSVFSQFAFRTYNKYSYQHLLRLCWLC